MKSPGLLSRFFSKTPARNPAAPRIFAYCASNVGAGPLLRLSRVLAEVKAQRPEISILLATDALDPSPAEAIGAAVLRLPKFEYIDAEQFKERPQYLNLKNRELADLRAATLLEAGAGFGPDLIFADTNPHGKRDELLPLLRHARRKKIKTALMMRDIPAAENETFKLRGAAKHVLEHARYYDALMIAGDSKFHDAAAANCWPAGILQKLTHSGFIIPPTPTLTRAQAFNPWPTLDPERPIVVASCGGGWQPEALVPNLLEGLKLYRAQFLGAVPQLLIFTGPAITPVLFNAWRAEAAALGGVAVEKFSPDFAAALYHSDFAILQAGSTLFQVLESAKPILILTRPFKTSEQAERAVRVTHLPGVRVESATPTPVDAQAWIEWGLATQIPPRHTGFSFTGTSAAAACLLSSLFFANSLTTNS